MKRVVPGFILVLIFSFCVENLTFIKCYPANGQKQVTAILQESSSTIKPLFASPPTDIKFQWLEEELTPTLSFYDDPPPLPSPSPTEDPCAVQGMQCMPGTCTFGDITGTCTWDGRDCSCQKECSSIVNDSCGRGVCLRADGVTIDNTKICDYPTTPSTPCFCQNNPNYVPPPITYCGMSSSSSGLQCTGDCPDQVADGYLCKALKPSETLTVTIDEQETMLMNGDCACRPECNSRLAMTDSCRLGYCDMANETCQVTSVYVGSSSSSGLVVDCGCFPAPQPMCGQTTNNCAASTCTERNQVCVSTTDTSQPPQPICGCLSCPHLCSPLVNGMCGDYTFPVNNGTWAAGIQTNASPTCCCSQFYCPVVFNDSSPGLRCINAPNNDSTRCPNDYPQTRTRSGINCCCMERPCSEANPAQCSDRNNACTAPQTCQNVDGMCACANPPPCSGADPTQCSDRNNSCVFPQTCQNSSGMCTCANPSCSGERAPYCSYRNNTCTSPQTCQVTTSGGCACANPPPPPPPCSEAEASQCSTRNNACTTPQTCRNISGMCACAPNYCHANLSTWLNDTDWFNITLLGIACDTTTTPLMNIEVELGPPNDINFGGQKHRCCVSTSICANESPAPRCMLFPGVGPPPENVSVPTCPREAGTDNETFPRQIWRSPLYCCCPRATQTGALSTDEPGTFFTSIEEEEEEGSVTNQQTNECTGLPENQCLDSIECLYDINTGEKGHCRFVFDTCICLSDTPPLLPPRPNYCPESACTSDIVFACTTDDGYEGQCLRDDSNLCTCIRTIATITATPDPTSTPIPSNDY